MLVNIVPSAIRAVACLLDPKSPREREYTALVLNLAEQTVEVAVRGDKSAASTDPRRALRRGAWHV